MGTGVVVSFWARRPGVPLWRSADRLGSLHPRGRCSTLTPCATVGVTKNLHRSRTVKQKLSSEKNLAGATSSGMKRNEANRSANRVGENRSTVKDCERTATETY